MVLGVPETSVFGTGVMWFGVEWSNKISCLKNISILIINYDEKKGICTKAKDDSS
jgi:hypothetical protein